MKKKKTLLLISILTLIAFLSPRLIVLSLATWDYYHTDIICNGKIPTPPTGLKDQVYIFIYEVNRYSVLTDQGHLFPGDEYVVPQEVWVGGGAADLLWTGRNGAIFLITYPISDPESGRWISTSTCRWFAPIGDYR
jgi:hypothetical protein